MPYSSAIHKFLSPGQWILDYSNASKHRFLHRELLILCKAVRFSSLLCPTLLTCIFFMYSISLPILDHPPPNNKYSLILMIVSSKEQARLHSVIPLISVGLFISNFQHFVHSAVHVCSSGKACMVKSIISLQQVPRPSMIIYFTS